MRWRCSRRSASGPPAWSLCRPSPGADADASPRARGARAIIGRSRPRRWRRRCRKKLGEAGPGREAPTRPLPPRSAAVRIRPATRDGKLTAPQPLEWLLIEWPEDEREPTKYWLSTLPEDTPIEVLVDTAKLRWRIERDYEEPKSELGLEAGEDSITTPRSASPPMDS